MYPKRVAGLSCAGSKKIVLVSDMRCGRYWRGDAGVVYVMCKIQAGM